jgi:hypothetical protein
VKGVDREFPLFFGVIDENQSWYLEENFKYCLAAKCGGQTDHFEFVESNQMNVINGLIYGNLKVYACHIYFRWIEYNQNMFISNSIN